MVEKEHPTDQLSPATQAAFAQAQAEARSLNQNYVGTEHLLLGLMTDVESSGSRILQSFGASAERVRKALIFITQNMSVQEAGTQIEEQSGGTDTPGLTRRAQAAVTLAGSEAHRLHQKLITPEILLIGILREGEGIGAGILRSLGVNLEKVRAQIYASLVGEGRSNEGSPSKANVITCRIGDQDVDAIDALVEAGVRNTRSEAAAWLIHAGIEANKTLLDTVYGTVAEIRRLRIAAQALARDANTERKD